MILITGAAGNIGRRLMAGLSDTVGVDVRPGVDHVIDLVATHYDSAPWPDLLPAADAVIHLATSADPEADEAVHFAAVSLTARLVAACARYDVPRLILPSSGWADPGPGKTLNAYGASKRAIEAMAAMYGLAAGRSAVALRFGWVPGDPGEVALAPNWLQADYWPDERLLLEVRAALEGQGRD